MLVIFIIIILQKVYPCASKLVESKTTFIVYFNLKFSIYIVNSQLLIARLVSLRGFQSVMRPHHLGSIYSLLIARLVFLRGIQRVELSPSFGIDIQQLLIARLVSSRGFQIVMRPHHLGSIYGLFYSLRSWDCTHVDCVLVDFARQMCSENLLWSRGFLVQSYPFPIFNSCPFSFLIS